MNLWKKIKYGLWPAIKMKFKIWWYSMRYGGKENIPPDVIFGEMKKSMAQLQENLMNALRSIPEDLEDDDKDKLMEVLQKAKNLDSDMRKVGEEAEKKTKK